MKRVSIGEMERQKCYELSIEAASIYGEMGDDDMKETLNRIAYEFEDPYYEIVVYEMPDDWWEDLVRSLRMLENRSDYDTTSIAWLRSKIAKRANLGALDKGFSTFTPIGYIMSDEDPGTPLAQ